VIFKRAGRETGHSSRIVENRAKCALACSVWRPAVKPMSFVTVHIEQNSIVRLVQKTAVINQMYSTSMEIEFYVIFLCYSGRMGAPFLA
jgi:hypothetical protein